MRRKWILVLSGLMMLAGLTVLLYPAVSNLINRMHGSYAIQELQEQVEKLDEEEFSQALESARDYNRRLNSTTEDREKILEEYDEILNFGDGLMGYISIPKIGVKLPVYHGVDSEILEKGIGHMPISAFPIGGPGNHSILTGHTGLPSAELFTDLVKMETEDVFEVVVGEYSTCYRVDQIRVVLPEETEDLTAVPGKDYCTLVTCTPYGINSHRLLVRGVRQNQQAMPPEEVAEEEEEQTQYRWWQPVPGVLLLILAMKRKRGREYEKN